jgi:hypothetical protein
MTSHAGQDDRRSLRAFVEQTRRIQWRTAHRRSAPLAPRGLPSRLRDCGHTRYTATWRDACKNAHPDSGMTGWHSAHVTLDGIP